MEAEEEETRVAVRGIEPAPIEAAERPHHSTVQVDLPIFTIGPTLMFVKIGYVLAAFGAVIAMVCRTRCITRRDEILS